MALDAHAEKPETRLAGLVGMRRRADRILAAAGTYLGAIVLSVGFDGSGLQPGDSRLGGPFPSHDGGAGRDFSDVLPSSGRLASGPRRRRGLGRHLRGTDDRIVVLQRPFCAHAASGLVSAAAATALFGFLAVACLAGTSKQRPALGGALAALISWLVMSVHSLHETHSEVGQSVFAVIATLAALAAYVNLCSMPRLAPNHEIFRVLTFVAAIATAIQFDALSLYDINFASRDSVYDLLGRFAAASWHSLQPAEPWPS